MSTQMKLIIPLLDEGLSPDLFTAEAGFLDAYSADINRPYLDNHIFLMYEADLSDPKNYYRNEKIMKLKNLYNRTMVRIRGILVMIYTFCINKFGIRQILKGFISLSDSEKYDILQFWDKDISVCMTLAINKPFDEISNAIVPEQDYNPSKEKGSAQQC